MYQSEDGAAGFEGEGIEEMELQQAETDSDQQNFQKAVEEAMSIDLILESILRHLDTRSLVRNCRLVNKKWNEEATKILKRRTDAAVKVNQLTDVAALAACIAGSKDFPFRKIVLWCIEVEYFGSATGKWVEVMELLQEHTTVFTRIWIEARGVPDTLVSDLLGGLFSHMEHLELGRMQLKRLRKSKKGKEEERKSSAVDEVNLGTLERLKTIVLASRTYCDNVDLTFLEALVQSSPNLQRVENFTSAYLDVLSITGKLGALKSVRVCSTCDEWDRNKDFPWPSGIETLIVKDVYHDDYEDDDEGTIQFSSFQPLLVSSRESLRRIEFRVRKVLGSASVQDWPKLSNIATLKLFGVYTKFPDSVKDIFPSLNTIQLAPDPYMDFREFDPFHLSDCLWKEPLQSVTKLKVSACFFLDHWKYLSKSVPNVCHILLNHVNYGTIRDKNPAYSSQAMDFWAGVGYFKHLETLFLAPIELTVKTNLDEFFTGILGYALENLRENPELPLIRPPECIDAVLRKTKSVASLSGLKELIIPFTLSDKVTRDELMRKKPISHVALQYGFNMIPEDVKIHFLYDHWSKNAELIKEVLSPVAGRVTFGHWNANLGFFPGLEDEY